MEANPKLNYSLPAFLLFLPATAPTDRYYRPGTTCHGNPGLFSRLAKCTSLLVALWIRFVVSWNKNIADLLSIPTSQLHTPSPGLGLNGRLKQLF